MIVALSSFAIQAQIKGDVALNGAFLTHESHLSGVEDLTIAKAGLEFNLDLFGGKKFNFGPVGKFHIYEEDYFGGKDQNNYDFSLGLSSGVDLGKFSFDVSGEFPFADQRENIFEFLISPSATYMVSDKVGIKGNFDYFINKKLFNYAYSYGVGVVYKF